VSFRHAWQEWDSDSWRRWWRFGEVVVDATKDWRRRQDSRLCDRGQRERFEQVEAIECQVAMQRHKVHRYVLVNSAFKDLTVRHPVTAMKTQFLKIRLNVKLLFVKKCNALMLLFTIFVYWASTDYCKIDWELMLRRARSQSTLLLPFWSSSSSLCSLLMACL